MKKYIMLLFAALVVSLVSGQNKVAFLIQDNDHKEPLIGVHVSIETTGAGAISDAFGRVEFLDVPNGTHVFHFSYIGYNDETRSLKVPLESSEIIPIMLASGTEVMDEIIVESTRANKSIATIPTRIEVLTDEIDEAASMEPSRISHLITHTTGVQVQTTSASSNGAVVRIQGLNGRYSKMLRDGFPLYGGLSGSLDVLQIPPLDLRQIEFIKGSSSTLHGGGAIAGVLNLLTKTPDEDEMLLHFNRSDIGSNDLNAFVSRRFGKFGITNLVSYQLHDPYDADADGYSDLPDLAKFNFNPRLYYYPGEQTTLYLGMTVTRDTRKGGDMRLLDNVAADEVHFYYDLQESKRYTTEFKVQHDLKNGSGLVLKNSLNFFDRYLRIQEAPQSAPVVFGGMQKSSFTEMTYAMPLEKHDLLFGISLTTDDFERDDLEENAHIPIEEEHLTFSGFVNHTWDATNFLDVESGMRVDWNKNKSNISEDDGTTFFMPRIAVLIRYNDKWSTRIGGGLGYRPMTLFNEEAEPYGYGGFQPIDFASTEAETSIGLNADISYKSQIGDNALLSINHMFFNNIIENPVVVFADQQTFGFTNGSADLISRGFETQMKFSFRKITWFLGYTFTDAYFDDEHESPLVLNPKHSIKGDFLFVEEDKWRIGVDYEYKSGQYLSNGSKTRDLFATGMIIERTIRNFVLFFNAENVTDTRQTEYTSLLSGPNNTPQFTEVWAPLDGRFFNFGLKIKME